MLDKSFTTLLDASFGDVDQLCSDVRHWDLEFQPLTATPSRATIGRVIQGGSRRFDCAYARFLINIDQRGAPPPGKFTFTIPGKKLNSIWWQGQHVEQQDILVYVPGTEMRSVTGRDFEVHLISLTEADIAHYAERCGLMLPSLSRLPSVFKAPDSLAREAQNVLGRMTSNPDGIDDCSLDEIAEKLVICWLSQIGIASRRKHVPQSSIALDRILSAVSSGEAASIRLSEICADTGLSRRALEIAFRERFDLSPAAFLKTSRLSATRRELMVATPQKATVGDIMAKSGFSHVGQFATDYRRMFGELPSDTLKQSGHKGR